MKTGCLAIPLLGPTREILAGSTRRHMTTKQEGPSGPETGEWIRSAHRYKERDIRYGQNQMCSAEGKDPRLGKGTLPEQAWSQKTTCSVTSFFKFKTKN